MSKLKPSRVSVTVLLAVAVLLLGDSTTHAGMLYMASLRNGDYGGGQAINTFAPNHGASPGVLGIVDSAQGVTYMPTETDGRSNALLNWVIPAGNRTSLRNSGTVSFFFRADREDHMTGSLIGENYGFSAFRNGQSTFGSFLSREANGDGLADDTVQVGWNTWHNGVWTPLTRATGLDYDRWYNVGLTWGGPDNDIEIWVDGVLSGSSNLPNNLSFPWGFGSAGTNIGIGDNHERGYDVYGSTSGAMFADIEIWDEYRPNGETVPEPATLVMLALGGIVALRRRANT